MKVNDVYRRQQFRKIDHDGDEINFPPSPPLNYINNYTDPGEESFIEAQILKPIKSECEKMTIFKYNTTI